MEPTPEECARQILEVFKRFGCREGDFLLANSLYDDFLAPSWQPRDLATGLESAKESGWIVQNANGELFLTKLGADQIS